MRARLLATAGVLALLAGALLAAGGDHARADDPPASTIGVNALVMSAEPATYRLRLDGTASRAGAAPVDSGSYPGGPFRSSLGMLASADRKGGLTRLVISDPASGRKRVAASHVCGDAFNVNPWSPDGRSLAIGVSPAGGGCNGHGGVQVAVWNSGKLRRVGPFPSNLITWSADGSQLLLAVQGGPLLVDLRTGKRRKVLRSGEKMGPGAWSSGRRAFATHGFDSAHREAVFLIDGALRRVVRTVLWGSQLAWSPSAQLLAVSDGKSVRVIDGRTGKGVAVIPANTRST